MTVDADTKVCPDCAEEIRALARVCRFCGFRFEPQPEPEPLVSAERPEPPPQAVAPDPEPVVRSELTDEPHTITDPSAALLPRVPAASRKALKDRLRWPVLVVGVALGAFLFAQPDSLCGGFADGAELAGSVIAAAVGVVVWLFLVAAIMWASRKITRNPSAYRPIVTGYPVIIVALTMTYFASVGRIAERRVCDDPAAVGALPAKDQGISDEQASYLAFTRDMKPVLDDLGAAIIAHNKFVDSVSTAAGFKTAGREAAKRRDALIEIDRRMRLITTQDPKVLAILELFSSATSDFVRAYRLYALGFSPFTETVVGRGDKLWDRGLRSYQEAVKLARAREKQLGAR